jgi:predicted nuclease of predicted toxin-antitoxin system
VKFLLDEQLSERTARSLTALEDGEFEHILDTQQPGTGDQEIPGICRQRTIDALITVNVRDFGAKKLLYEALLAQGISVVVLRPGKMKMDAVGQARLILDHFRRVQAILRDAGDPTLIVVTASEARSRRLADLIAEFEPED